MVIKRIVIAVGLLAALVGVSQLAFASWWVNAVSQIVNTRWMAVSGIGSILFGALMLVAMAEKVVGLRALCAVLGLYGLGAGVLVILNPEMARDIINAVMLKRTPSLQMFVIWTGGVLRVVVGSLIVYAAVKSPRAANGSQPNEEQP